MAVLVALLFTCPESVTELAWLNALTAEIVAIKKNRKHFGVRIILIVLALLCRKRYCLLVFCLIIVKSCNMQ